MTSISPSLPSQPERWVRSGECCRCGECCRSGNPLDVEPQIEGACALLALLPDGLHACTDREHPYYLSGCNVWPSRPEHVVDYPSCSYTFEAVS